MLTQKYKSHTSKCSKLKSIYKMNNRKVVPNRLDNSFTQNREQY